MSIGYSIGYGVLHDPDDGSKFFSIVHNFIGTVIITAWVSFFVRWTIDKKKNWKVSALTPNPAPAPVSIEGYIMAIIDSPYKHIAAWFGFLIFGLAWSCT